MMCQRAKARVAFGKTLAEQGVVQEWIADARIKIDQARLLVLKTAWLIDNFGVKGARTEIAAIKVVAPTCSPLSPTERCRPSAPPVSPTIFRSPSCGRWGAGCK